MDDRARGLVSKGLPWNRDAQWPVVAVEAVVLILVGAFALIDTDTASDIALQVIGAALLVASVLLALSALRNHAMGLGFYDAFRAGIGITCGIIATASWWFDYISSHTVRIILGWVLVRWSVFHLVGLVVMRGRGSLRMAPWRWCCCRWCLASCSSAAMTRRRPAG